MKAGTTWIYEYLLARGDVRLPANIKETFFFDQKFSKGLKWYLKHFDSDSLSYRCSVEVAPSYFHNPDVPDRIRSAAGSAQIIVTLRHPVERAWSHYLHMKRYGYTRDPLQVAVESYPQILKASCYFENLQRWWRVFGESNVHVLWQEDMGEDLQAYTRTLCGYLDIDFLPIQDELHRKVNEAAVAPSFRLAAIGRKASYMLRDRRMYPIVNLAKRFGLKAIFFGRPDGDKPTAMSAMDREWLTNRLSSDYKKLSSRYRAGI